MDSSGKAFAILLLALFITCLVILPPAQVRAQTKTIIVPDDYPTIQAAIANANDYDTIFVKAGTYEGPTNQTLRIDKPLSLIGESVESTKINLYPDYNLTWLFATPYLDCSDAIEIFANDVILINFTITPSPSGDINVDGNRTRIEGNNIARGLTITGSHNFVARNTIDYRFTLKNTSFNVIDNNSISESFYMEYANSNLIANNTCKGFTIGYYGYTCSSNIVIRNIINGDDYLPWGIGIDNSGTDNIFAGNNVSGYRGLGYGGYGANLAQNAINNTFYHNNFFDNNKNAVALQTSNSWDNGFQGNYWDDYAGTDNNFDGVGDTPYLINTYNIDHYPLLSPFDINSETIELPEWANATINPAPTPAPSQEPEQEPLPTTLIIGPTIIIAVVAFGLLLLRRHRKT